MKLDNDEKITWDFSALSGFKVGDIVAVDNGRGSGSMLIESINAEGTHAKCGWFEDRVSVRDTFDVDFLVLIDR